MHYVIVTFGGGVASCDVFYNIHDCEKLSCAVYCTLERLWKVEVENIL